MRLRERVAIVTGGGKGIGEAAALRFAEEGARVMVVDCDESAGAACARAIVGRGGAAAFFAADLTQRGAAEEMVRATLQRFARLDCAFNNVGGSVKGGERPMHEIDLDAFEAELRLNLTSTLMCLRAELAAMLASNTRGAIVNTSSLAGLGGTLSNPAYTAGKHGVIGLTKNAAVAYGQRGIRVNAVCPGTIRTPGLVANFAGNPDYLKDLAHAALERVAEASEVASVVVWLCSDEASFLTGAAIPVDGGTSAFAVRVASSRAGD
ncbi:MAG: SDR family oxidoreductase [Deltaproteobacteria bacterium]|nr:SDR family oxidoreductase [Deltaproteobacteria bacterium]